MSLKYEIIYAQDISSAGMPALIVSRLLNKRLFLRIGGDLLWERLAEKGKTSLSLVNFYKDNSHLKYYLYHVGQLALMEAEKIIVPSEILANIYENHYGIKREKIIVIKNPLPVIKNKELLIKDNHPENKILFAGRFVKYRNLEKLIIAFANVYNEIKPAKLVLVGDGPEKRPLVRLVKKFNLRSLVIFKDKIPHDLLINEINGSSFCVCPTLTDINPNFILECLSLEKPVLLTRENGLSVKLPERFLLDAGDIKDMEEKIIDLISLHGKADDSLVDAIKRTKILSWDDIISEHIKLFKN